MDARGHSNGEQDYLRMQLQATMYSFVRTDCAVLIKICGNRVVSG